MTDDSLEISALPSLTPVLITGDDTRKFLQGQLGNDVRKLSAQSALFASCHTPQGHVQTILTLIDRPEGVFALIPTHAVTHTLARMQRYVLRERIAFTLAEDWLVAAVPQFSFAHLQFDAKPERAGQCVGTGQGTLLRWWSSAERYLVLARRGSFRVCEQDLAEHANEWRRADIAAGLPSVHLETREAFMPQMLNLDLLQGLSYDKGCYVGQESIARTRHAGTPRRMYRYAAKCAPPAPGTLILHRHEPVGTVVDAADGCSDDERCELLATVDSACLDEHLVLDDPANTSLTTLELPYETHATHKQ